MRSILLAALVALLPAAAGARIWLEPAVQRCASVEARLDEMAAVGQSTHDLARPARLLHVVAEANAGQSGARGTATLGDLTIAAAVARASIGNAPTSAAYMTITTAGAPDRLVAAESPAAGAAELHASAQEGGVSSMRPVEAIPVAPDAPAELSPGGYHIMLIGLVAPLEDGTTVPLTLTFEKAGKVTLDVPVSRDIAAHAH
jgi:periplasmic copper chaperone A